MGAEDVQRGWARAVWSRKTVAAIGVTGVVVASLGVGAADAQQEPTGFAELPVGEWLGNGRAAGLSTTSGEGVAIAGLHWLLAAPAGLSITSTDEETSRLTREVGRRLLDLCAELGGSYLVHGSPQQRMLPPGREAEGRARGIAYFAAIAEEAEAAGLVYVIEPLSRLDTAFVTTVDEALAIIREIGSPALKTMVDCYATAANDEDVPGLLDRHLASSDIFHVHFNDDDKRGPGEGGIDFAAVLAALQRHGYAGAAAVEPFVYLPDGPACAARAIGYLRGIEAGLRDAAESVAGPIAEPSG